ncbi:MAG: DNA-formamidopyrimidine glycosylase family protein [Salinirussus sp.]
MEGPSVHRVADELQRFAGQTVSHVGGNADQPLDQLTDRRIDAVRAVKKRLFLDLGTVHIVIHFLMYGSYRVNETRDLDERLRLECTEDTLNVYSCSVKVLEDGDEELAAYDRPTEDVLSETFDTEQATKALLTDDRPVADVLLDQSVFGGVGNIVKNEVLWEVGLDPSTPATTLDEIEAEELTAVAVEWTADWYRTKCDGGELGLSVYQCDSCPDCGAALEREELGEYDRITYWCPTCQGPAGSE